VSKFGALVEEHKRRKEQGGEPPVPDARKPKIGRPPGKRSNPEYEQVTSYVRKDTYKGVKVALIQAGEKKQFSDLVEELLTEWLAGSKGHGRGQ
jgi:hypothetical protein